MPVSAATASTSAEKTMPGRSSICHIWKPLLYAKHCAKCFTFLISLRTHNSTADAVCNPAFPGKSEAQGGT